MNEASLTEPAAVGSSLQAELREFKREKVLDAATRLFYEKGYSNTTVEELARSLGVTKPFVYRYFKNKEAILVAMYERRTDRILDLLSAAIGKAEHPDEQLAIFLDSFVRENMDSVKEGMIYMQEEKNLDVSFRAGINALQRRFDNELAQLISRGVEQKYFQAKDPKIAALAITGMVRWMQRWYKSDGRLSEAEVSSTLKDMAMNSLCYSQNRKK